MHVGHSTTETSPSKFSIGIALGGPIDLEFVCIVDGRLHPQHRTLLVVHLDRVLVDTVLDPKAFHTTPHVADHFSAKLSMHMAGGRSLVDMSNALTTQTYRLDDINMAFELAAMISVNRIVVKP